MRGVRPWWWRWAWGLSLLPDDDDGAEHLHRALQVHVDAGHERLVDRVRVLREPGRQRQAHMERGRSVWVCCGL